MIRYRKIYIICSGIKPTGGIETLHQLCDKINESKHTQAYIHYINKQSKVIDIYEKYNIRLANTIEDNNQNLLIVPEGVTYYLYRFKHINKAIFWLSLDYYFRSNIDYRVNNFLKSYKYLEPFKTFLYFYLSIIKDQKKIYNFSKKEGSIKHFYNCEYIREYLLQKRVDKKNMYYLCGPLSDIYFEICDIENIDKQNIVVYNPAKGKEICERIANYFKSRNSELEFIPIENMTTLEVYNLLKKSKVYMDFGYFPGPERIPREAVMLYCNILTSRLGAANNTIDVPIDEKYKFDTEELDIEKVYNLINELIYNYKEYLSDFNLYREKVFNQKKLFNDNISKLLT